MTLYEEHEGSTTPSATQRATVLSYMSNTWQCSPLPFSSPGLKVFKRSYLRWRDDGLRSSQTSIPRSLWTFLSFHPCRKWHYRHAWKLLLGLKVYTLQSRHGSPPCDRSPSRLLLPSSSSTPFIRHKFRLYHWVAGYIIILLIICGNAGAIMVANGAMGGDLPTQTFIGFIAITTIGTFGLALYNIKRLQIDQHRAWMLRTWFYLAFIISLRLIQAIVALIVSVWPAATRYETMSCDQLDFIYHNRTALYSEYPLCQPSNANLTSDGRIIVKAHLGGTGGPKNAALEVSFSTAGFLALILHAIGVEIYLRPTPRESERLRMISYERQLKRGLKNPGSAGLTVDRIGDADAWRPVKSEDRLQPRTNKSETKDDTEITKLEI